MPFFGLFPFCDQVDICAPSMGDKVLFATPFAFQSFSSETISLIDAGAAHHNPARNSKSMSTRFIGVKKNDPRLLAQ